jgi:adenylosuccinate lyase
VTREDLHQLIQRLAIPDEEKKRLLALTPATYFGLASVLAHRV